MDDRVRIYELSRRMNIPNQEIIKTLRELGYDVKSHSSTVDSAVVGNLIAALGKKEQSQSAASKSAPKAGGKLPPPPEKKPDKQRPRVIGRYKKKLPDSELIPVSENPAAHAGTASPGAPGELRAISPSLPAGGLVQLPASQISSTPRQPRVISTEARTTGNEEPAQDMESAPESPALATADQSVDADAQASHPAMPSLTESEEPTSTTQSEAGSEPSQEIAESSEPISEEDDKRDERGITARDVTPDAWSDESKYAPRAIRNLDKHFQDKQKKELARSKRQSKTKEDEDESLDIEEVDETINGTETNDNEQLASPAAKADESDSASARDHQSRAVRPMSPSVPIRVAAPSMRATPPRPPKSHRHSAAQKGPKKEEEKKIPAANIEVPKVVTLSRNLTVQELSEKMHLPAVEIIKHLFMKGIMRTVNQLVELEAAKELAADLEYEVLQEEVRAAAAKDAPSQADAEDVHRITRPPVVTIMGHVDHGKTSLLDAIRQTKLKLTEGEAGGITQHIGAYHVEVEHEEGIRQIVFLDTPGHEAFTAMRARGARATDIAILVVAADDGVMPQTIEAIDHAKAANVPIIVAVNKIDRPNSDPDRVLSQLMEHDLLPDTYGGETVTCNVSAKEKIGLDDLLEMILLVADMQDLRANPDKAAQGVIVEAEKSIGKGPVATALVQNGTLREGDCIVVGSVGGRVRALFDDRGNRVKAAGPSMPVEVLGLDDVPKAGEPFHVVDDMADMKSLVDKRREDLSLSRGQHVTLESFHDLLASGEIKELNVIIKADVQGTAEAIADSVRKLSDENVQVRILRAASGNISENDVNLAASSNAIVIGFNCQPDSNARSVADDNSVDIRTYSIIYQITDDLTKAVQGLLEPVKKEVKIGSAEVRQLFRVGKGLVIAGCMVTEGKITRGSIARVERAGEILYDGKIDTLKRFKDDVKEVASGYECGMSFDKFSDLQEGDRINAFIIEEVKRV